MTLYSTSAAALRIGTTRGTVARLAAEAHIGRGAGGSEDVAWLFTEAELATLRQLLAEGRSAA